MAEVSSEASTPATGLARTVRSAERLLQGVLNSSHDGIMAFSSIRDEEGAITDFEWTIVNPASERIVGRTADDLVGKRLLEEMPGNRVSGLFDAYVRVIETGEPYVVEHHYDHEDLDHWFFTTAVRLDDGFAVTFQDVTEQKRLQFLLEHQILHDQLTGLPNRVLLEDRINHDLARLTRQAGAVTLTFLDLDRFKVVNDNLGHAAGDELLVQFAQRIVSSLRPTDTVARVGGDEFVVLFDHVAEDDLDAAISRLIQTCDAPFRLEGQEVFVGVTVGVARTTSADTTADVLIADADGGMYEAKQLGGNRARFAESTARKLSTDRVQLEAELRHAVERDELRVIYQPVVDCATGRISGAEALVRWQHPTRGLLAPNSFLLIAEVTGLIGPIGSWVLEQATADLRDWDQQFRDASPAVVSVNASAQQLTSTSFTDEVEAVLTSTGLQPGRLCIEVTETALIRDPIAAQRTLHGLSELGVLIALDDFGTGYSPITYLQRFPVDIIKIDRGFISGRDASSTDAALVDGLIGLADALDKTVTVEGVEDEAQLARIAKADHYQGFYFSRPLDRAAFDALLGEST